MKLWFGHVLSQPLLQAFAKSLWQIKGLAVCDQANHVASAVDDGRAMGAVPEVGRHALPQNGIEIALDVIRDLSPDMNATDLDNCH